MNIGILGSGIVAQTLGAHLSRAGHSVLLGTRTPDDLDTKRGMGATLEKWLDAAAPHGSVATFRDCAAQGEVLVNATSGTGSLAALRLAGEDELAGKILLDVANPLDFSRGMPPTLTICNTSSLGEQIQEAFPATKVVKTLNTMNAQIMVDPASVGGGDHHVFVSGNDADAKRTVTAYLQDWFGWREVIDLGGIETARGAEMILPIWLNLWGSIGSPRFNFKVVR